MNYFFVTLLAACTAYAFLVGGGPERIGAAAYALAAAATHLVLLAHTERWQTIEFGVFIIDTLVFIVFAILAVRANRFWPIWVSALLGLGVLGHLARLAGADVYWWAYAVVLTIWSYPIVALIAIGTFQHRQRLKRFGTDPDWVGSSDRSPPSPLGS